VISVGFYFITAILLKERIGFLGLVLADSAKQAGHAVIMTILFYRSVGRMRGQRILRTLALSSLASVLMAALCAWIAAGITSLVPPGKAGYALIVGLAGGAGLIFYVAVLRLVRVEEIAQVTSVFAARLGIGRR
jgi:zinc transporter ZupT